MIGGTANRAGLPLCQRLGQNTGPAVFQNLLLLLIFPVQLIISISRSFKILLFFSPFFYIFVVSLNNLVQQPILPSNTFPFFLLLLTFRQLHRRLLQLLQR